MNNVKKSEPIQIRIVFVIIALISIVGIMASCSNLSKPVIDNRLIGTWKSSSFGHVDVWSFKSNGTYTMTRTFSNTTMEKVNVENYYRAENGILKTSFSKNVNDYTTGTYEYQLGVSENDTPCLILTMIKSGGIKNTEILYKVQ